MVEPRRVERVQRMGPRRELAQEEVLGRQPPRGREPAHRALQRPVRVDQPRPDDGGARVRLAELDQPVDRVADYPGVSVQDQEPAAARFAHPAVPAGREAPILLLDEPRFREAIANELERPVRRAVVDDDGLVAAHALETALHVRQRVQRHHDDGHVRAGHALVPLQ